MGSTAEQFGWGLRLLIMTYGFGIVLIGLDPIKKEHGNLAKFLSQDSIVRAAEAFDPKKILPTPGSRVEGALGEEVATKPDKGRPKLDQLTADDRKQLNKLMEGL